MLLIADGPDEQAMMVQTLRQSGIRNEIALVRDADEAIEFTEGTGRYAGQSIARLPSLILLDLVSPQDDGSKMLRQLRERPRTRFVPIVVLTPLLDQQDLHAGFGSGANSLVLKPADADEFAKTLGQVARYWLEINQPAP